MSWQMLSFAFWCPKRWFQFNSRIVRTHFSSVMTLNNWKMIAETRNYILRWRSCFCQRRVCLSTENVISKYNFTLYHKSFAIILSCSRHALLAKYPKKRIGTRDFRVKIENERFSVTCSRCHLVISRGRYAKNLKIFAKIRAARQARLFMIFQSMISMFCGVALLLPLSFLKLPEYIDFAEPKSGAPDFMTITNF